MKIRSILFIIFIIFFIFKAAYPQENRNISEDANIVRIHANDTIFLKDGNIIKGKIVKVTIDSIIYLTVSGDNRIILRDDVKKIMYSSGEEVQISEDNIEQNNNFSKDRNDVNIQEERKYKFYFILPIFGLGYNSNPDLTKWNKEQTQRYVNYLRNTDVKFSNCYADSSGSSYDDFLLMNIAMEARVFIYNTVGIGLNLGYTKMWKTSTIGGQPDYADLSLTTDFITYYYGISIYYKKNITTEVLFKPYLLLGAGLNKYHMKYDNSITYTKVDSKSSGPYSNLFNENYRSESLGYHGIIGFGFDLHNFTFYSSIYIPYAVASDFKSGSKEMRLNNGNKVDGKISGVVFLVGVAVNI
ncbi:MAG: hypothetical protein V1874_14185 [Spirochaetota bacterium]